MLAKAFYLIALIIFVVLAVADPTTKHLVEWAFASLAAGLLVDGYGPAFPVTHRRE